MLNLPRPSYDTLDSTDRDGACSLAVELSADAIRDRNPATRIAKEPLTMPEVISVPRTIIILHLQGIPQPMVINVDLNSWLYFASKRPLFSFFSLASLFKSSSIINPCPNARANVHREFCIFLDVM